MKFSMSDERPGGWVENWFLVGNCRPARSVDDECVYAREGAHSVSRFGGGLSPRGVNIHRYGGGGKLALIGDTMTIHDLTIFNISVI